MNRKEAVILSLAAVLTVVPESLPRNRITIPEREVQMDEVPGESKINILEKLLTPLTTEALIRREKVFNENSQIMPAVDQQLNEGRLNFLLFGYGETHEPPVTERAFIGSYTLLSYVVRSGKYDLISFTHDIRAPEIERYKRKNGGEVPFSFKMGQAYGDGGFPLLREIIVNATGLYPDFCFYMPDVAVARFIDQVPHKIEVDSPREFNVHPIYLDGQKYPGIRTFKEGINELDGPGSIQFIKSVPVMDQGKDIEHNPRKARVIRGLVNSFKSNLADPGFWLRLKDFLESNEKLKQGDGRTVAFEYDVDPAMFISPVSSLIMELGWAKLQGAQINFAFPQEKSSTYIVDKAHGDGGVQWIGPNAIHNSITREDINRGFYPDPSTEVPIDANPYADELYKEYWGSVREVIKEKISFQE